MTKDTTTAADAAATPAFPHASSAYDKRTILQDAKLADVCHDRQHGEQPERTAVAISEGERMGGEL